MGGLSHARPYSASQAFPQAMSFLSFLSFFLSADDGPILEVERPE